MDSPLSNFAVLTLAQAAAPASSSSLAISYWIAVILVGAGLAIIAVVLYTTLRAKRAPAAAAAPVSYPSPEAAGVEPASTTQEAQNLLRLMGEAEDLCARLGRQLDDKAERIERLLARAEGRLGSQETVVVRPNLAPPPPPMPASAPPLPASTYMPPPAAAVQAMAARPEIVTRPIPIPAAVAVASVPSMSMPTPTSVETFGGLDPLTSRVYQLADAGLPPTEIAQQLGQHTGKVELILALRST